MSATTSTTTTRRRSTAAVLATAFVVGGLAVTAVAGPGPFSPGATAGSR